MKHEKGIGAGVLVLALMVIGGCVETDSTRPDWGGSHGGYWAARTACQDRIRDRIHRDRPKVERVRFGETEAWRGAGDRVRVRGEGRFLHRRNGWKDFHFKCEYSLDRDRILSASYRKEENGYGGGGGASGDWRSRNACKKALSQRITDRHPNATAIGWLEHTLRTERLSGNRLRYAGKGKYRGGKGKRRSFDFQCVYDSRGNRVTRLRVDIH